jgi:uncharacterized protein YigE (DUF2233 family)
MAARRDLSAGFALTLSLLCVGAAQVQGPAKGQVAPTLTVTDAGRWRTVQTGVSFRTIALERSEPSYTLELKLLRCDSRLIVPRILHAGQFQLKSAAVKALAEKSGAIAAINASYFDENRRPLAYLKTAAQEINRTVSKHALYTGIFGVGEGGPFVTHRDEFLPGQASEALQSGPLLLHRGATADFNVTLARYARRTVVGIDKQGQMIVGVTDALAGGLSFSEIQELFLNARWQLEAVDLLNLDGGGSSQLYVKSGKFEEWLPGTTEIPVGIGFFKRVS